MVEKINVREHPIGRAWKQVCDNKENEKGKRKNEKNLVN